MGSLVSNVKPGDHVIALSVIYCGNCDQCVSGNPSSCVNRESTRRRDDEKPRTTWHGQKVTPVSDGGAFAEKMLGHENSFVKIPDDMPMDRAALIGCAVTTSASYVLNTRRSSRALPWRYLDAAESDYRRFREREFPGALEGGIHRGG